jgi:hypothetical protein
MDAALTTFLTFFDNGAMDANRFADLFCKHAGYGPDHEVRRMVLDKVNALGLLSADRSRVFKTPKAVGPNGIDPVSGLAAF